MMRHRAEQGGQGIQPKPHAEDLLAAQTVGQRAQGHQSDGHDQHVHGGHPGQSHGFQVEFRLHGRQGHIDRRDSEGAQKGSQGTDQKRGAFLGGVGCDRRGGVVHGGSGTAENPRFSAALYLRKSTKSLPTRGEASHLDWLLSGAPVRGFSSFTPMLPLPAGLETLDPDIDHAIVFGKPVQHRYGLDTGLFELTFP